MNFIEALTEIIRIKLDQQYVKFMAVGVEAIVFDLGTKILRLSYTPPSPEISKRLNKKSDYIVNYYSVGTLKLPKKILTFKVPNIEDEDLLKHNINQMRRNIEGNYFKLYFTLMEKLIPLDKFIGNSFEYENKLLGDKFEDYDSLFVLIDQNLYGYSNDYKEFYNSLKNKEDKKFVKEFASLIVKALKDKVNVSDMHLGQLGYTKDGKLKMFDIDGYQKPYKKDLNKMVYENKNYIIKINENTFNEVKTIIDEDYPPSFDHDEFKSLNSHAARRRYAKQHLQRISTGGSSRVVYKIDDEKVLKLAKNEKGVAQNYNEFDFAKYDSYDVFAKVFDTDDNLLWIESEFAQKINANDFEKIVGFKWKYWNIYIEYKLVNTYVRQGRYSRYFNANLSDYIPNEILKEMHEDEWVYGLSTIAVDVGLVHGDLTRINSYGKVLRDGNPQVVALDYGATYRTIEDYYS